MSNSTFGTGGYFRVPYGGHYQTPPPPRPYVFPEPEPQWPQIQEGDGGKIILRQASLAWITDAINDIVRQLSKREKDIGHPLKAEVSVLADGSHLIEWGRRDCVDMGVAK